MKRREFITKTALASLLLSEFTPFNVIASGFSSLTGANILDDKNAVARLSAPLTFEFKVLLKWLQDNGWINYLNQSLSLKINASDTNIAAYIKKQQFPKINGFDDFAGVRLIEPGYPAGSLLYHALASPRVKPKGFKPKQYPSVKQLDVLENIIYGLKPMDNEDWDKMVLAVFAYEYRPAFKTPHH